MGRYEVSERRATLTARFCRSSLRYQRRRDPQTALRLRLRELWTGGEPRWERLLAHPRAKLHLYGKAQPRRARKMGHVTFVADTVAKAQAACGRAATLLGIA